MIQPHNYPINTAYHPATIGNGATKSAVIALYGLELVGIIVPTSYDGSTLGLEISDSAAGSFHPVNDGSGQVLSIPVVPGHYEPIAALSMIAGLSFIKLVAPVAQSGSDTVLTLALRHL